MYSITELTGSITVNSHLDFELISSYNLTIRAEDGGEPNRTSTQTVMVCLTDENDNAPMFVRTTFTAVIAENAANGSIVASVQATDADSTTNGEIIYTIVSVVVDAISAIDSPFEIDGPSGVVTVLNSTLLDNEQYSTFHIQVQATDMGISAQSSQVPVRM